MRMADIRNNRTGLYIFVAICTVAVGIGIAEICVVRYDLRKSYTDCSKGGWYWCQSYNVQCLLGDDPSSFGPCNYAYAVGGISLIFSGFIACFSQMKTILINTIVAFAGFGWWLAAAIVITQYSNAANDANLPEGESRTAIVALCWVNVVMFACLAAATAYFWWKNRNTPLPVPSGAPVAIQHYSEGVQMQPPQDAYAGPPPPMYQYTIGGPPDGYPPQGYQPPAGYPSPPPPYGGAQHGDFSEAPAQGIPVYPPSAGYPPPTLSYTLPPSAPSQPPPSVQRY